MRDEGRDRARLVILHYITQFSLSLHFGDGKTHGGLASSAFQVGQEPEIGDLVALTSAPVSKFYLGWLIDTRVISPGWPEYLVESIEDGEQCWWGNVGIQYMNRDTVKLHQSWRWTDKQYQFNDRWVRSCYRKRDAYIYLPIQSEFDGLQVKLGVRVRHNLSPERRYATFPDWRKVKVMDMLNFYDKSSKELEATP